MNGQINPNEHRARIIHEFDEALKICEPEFDSITTQVAKLQKEFLLYWKKYKKNGQSQEFLKISNEFANLLLIQNKMFKRNGNLLNPILAKLDKITSRGDSVE